MSRESRALFLKSSTMKQDFFSPQIFTAVLSLAKEATLSRFFFHGQKYVRGKTKLSQKLFRDKISTAVYLHHGDFFLKVPRTIMGTNKIATGKNKLLPPKQLRSDIPQNHGTTPNHTPLLSFNLYFSVFH